MKRERVFIDDVVKALKRSAKTYLDHATENERRARGLPAGDLAEMARLISDARSGRTASYAIRCIADAFADPKWRAKYLGKREAA